MPPSAPLVHIGATIRRSEETSAWPTNSSSTPIRKSRGRVARWMLEEIGQPYKTEVLDYAST